MSDILVSSSDLQSALGVTAKTITILKGKGLVVKHSRDKYNLIESVKRYTAHLREIASGRGGEEQVADLTEERARLAKEQADGQALKNAVTRKEYVAAKEVEFEWSDILRQVRAKVMSVPSRVRQSLGHLTVHDIELIDRELRSALEGVANEAALDLQGFEADSDN